MWEIFLATVISLSVGVREPRNISNAPFDYELSYKLENNYNNLDISFKHDYEREDGDYYNDIRAELNYVKNNIILKEDYKQITSKDLYQFNSDIRYQWRGLSIGYGLAWDLKEEYIYSASAGFSKRLSFGRWNIETENDIYYTKPLTYQTEGKVLYDITNKVGLGISANYIETLTTFDYSAKVVLTIKLREKK